MSLAIHARGISRGSHQGNGTSGIETERREEERHKQLYRFLPQTGSSYVPLALPRRVHYK